MAEATQETSYLTRAAFDRLSAELEQLKGEGRRDIAYRIECSALFDPAVGATAAFEEALVAFDDLDVDFDAAIDASMVSVEDGQIVEGKVVKVDRDEVLLDIGYKTEGVIPSRELSIKHDVDPDEVVAVGDTVEALVLTKEDKEGRLILSKKRAQYERAWGDIEKIKEEDGVVEGTVIEVVKGGLILDIGLRGFLPASLVEMRRVRDLAPYIGQKLEAKIIELDKNRNNVVLSRRAWLEQTQSEVRSNFLHKLEKGQVRNGTVSSIVNFGAFVDLGGVDGLLHVTDIAWRRINHPSEALTIGQQVKVQVIRFNPETQRISLGMKQLMSDPWDGVALKYPVNAKFSGRVTNITDYGAFVELEAGVEGLVHVSEMSWTKKNVHPGKIVSTSQEVDVMVLEIDEQKRRVSLGLKQTQRNPWEVFAETHPAGTPIEGEVKNITEFGLFVGLEGDIDGMVHLSDLSWDQRGEDAIQNYRKGDVVRAVVQEVDVDKERISLSIKALENDTMSEAVDGVKRGDVVTATVTAIEDGGIEVEYNGVKSFIRRSDLARDRQDQRPERFSVGDKVDVRVTNIDTKTRRLGLSIKAREIAEEKEAIDQYGSSDSGASLGDILGAALNRRG